MSTKFDVVVVAIEEAKDLKKLTLDELMGSLLSHEARIDRNKDSTLKCFQNPSLYFKRWRQRSIERQRTRR